jgi:hypothetical protein
MSAFGRKAAVWFIELMPASLRLPLPWSADDIGGCFVVQVRTNSTDGFYIVDGLVSAQSGARHVSTNFSAIFPQFGNCPSFGAGTRFSLERSDRL